MVTSGTARLRNLTRGTTLATDCHTARSFISRGVGLLLHSRLRDGEALRILRTSNITMLFMRFPIDALFLDAAGRVVRAAPDLQPWRISIAARGAVEVLELRAGTIAASGTVVGDTLVLE